METKIFLPQDPRLYSYVEYFWLLRSEKTEVSACPILPPEACFDVILSFASPAVWTSAENQQIILKSSFLSGMRKEPFWLDCQGKIEYLAIRFYPQALYNFLKISLSEIATMQAVELDLLENMFWKALTEKVANIIAIDQKIRTLETELLSVLDNETPPRSWLMEEALTHIHRSKGTLNIQTLCKHFRVYPKRLEREFKKFIGITPKFYSRLVRFNHILEHISRQPADIEWADLVYTFGYFDQSHFIKDFTRFLGHSPEQFQMLQKTYSAA